MVEFNPYDWKFHKDPYPTYKRLREEAPAYHNETLGFWALSRHADVVNALRDYDTYSSAEGVALEDYAQAAKDVMSFLAMDPPHHDQIRGLVWRGFTKRQVQRLSVRIRELAVEHLDRFDSSGSVDFIKDFAGKVPMDVVCELMSIPQQDREQVRAWADTIIHRAAGNEEIPPEALEAGGDLLQYMAGHIEKARDETDKREDLTCALIDARINDEPVGEADLIAMHFLLAIAGGETTTKLLGNALYWASKNPIEFAKVREDTSNISGWIEETLRYEPSSQMVARTTMRDVELHGCVIPKGVKVAMLVGAANRDHRVFEDPDAYNINREIKQSLAFGHGIHFCLGAHLGRLEAQICLEEVFKRYKTYEIDEAALERVHSPNVRGFYRMPIQFSD